MAMMFEDVIEQYGGLGELCDVYLIEKGTTQSEAASEWLNKHNIDPGWVADDSLVSRNAINHTITYSQIVFGVDPAKGEEDAMVVVGRYTVVDQNEAGPWPYPEEMKRDEVSVLP